ncbi:hypothetical protein [Cyclobacterium qasimii]|uniref:Uncharacterized protein n=2 Tax=Cyclobacterium qasimii TaxID=1350429 RepID=S7X478_9BACT|nr:hypothetical protein [Cyclobacterium qasimii]EPR70913.1 hypothetical protein ADICYQ_0727 [Cyclobacterium qasimii M12-11B]GEO19923.1 hypothetical protein CQA01_04570 [Cyclobacterium qasimii]
MLHQFKTQILQTFSFLFIASTFYLSSCQQAVPIASEADQKAALENGYLAHEGYRRSIYFVHAWLEYADKKSGLIPKNLRESKDIWNARDAAADNYPFMVLTSAILDKELYEGKMSEILQTEIKLTSRLDRLPDTYSFSKEGFENEEIDKTEIIFGSSEYIKDGLLPLTEYIGETPWSERMIGLIDDIWKNASYETPYGLIPSLNVEVNGELLQALSRVYWMTGEEKYLDWAKRLGDYYLLGGHHPTDDVEVLRLRDHGCEIVSGLCELYVAVANSDPEKSAAYKAPIYRMLDRILEVGTNEDGLFYNQINPQTGEILDEEIADTYGYTYNAYYSVFLQDNYQPYQKAVLKAMGNLHKYTNFDWEEGSADGYADAIESALNLYNRESLTGTKEWIDSEIQHMWSLQDSSHRRNTEDFRNTGVIEGWHGDGNFARTSIMYSLWKSQGVTASPWKEQLYLGATPMDKGILISMVSDSDWEGKIQFDRPRHKTIFKLPMDYPRINQLPEWFTVTEGQKYKVTFSKGGTAHTYRGEELVDGIEISLEKGQQISLIVVPLEK